jgi:hypothetical protein
MPVQKKTPLSINIKGVLNSDYYTHWFHFVDIGYCKFALTHINTIKSEGDMYLIKEHSVNLIKI